MFSEPNKSMLPSNTRKTALIFRISILKTTKKHKHIQLHLHPSYLKAKDKIVVFLKLFPWAKLYKEPNFHAVLIKTSYFIPIFILL